MNFGNILLFIIVIMLTLSKGQELEEKEMIKWQKYFQASCSECIDTLTLLLESSSESEVNEALDKLVIKPCKFATKTNATEIFELGLNYRQCKEMLKEALKEAKKHARSEKTEVSAVEACQEAKFCQTRRPEEPNESTDSATEASPEVSAEEEARTE